MPTWSLQFDPNDFLHSLCSWIVSTCATFTPPVTLVYLTSPRSLWKDLAEEANATDPYTVLKTYTGSPLKRASRYPRQSVQVQTTATSDGEGKAQIGAVFQCFTMPDETGGTAGDVGGGPLRGVMIPGYHAADDSADGHYLIVFADPLQRPGLTSRDEVRGRSTFTFNLEIGFRKES